MSKCEFYCQQEMSGHVTLNFNGKTICYNCIIQYVFDSANDIPEQVTLIDDEYTYNLGKDLFVSFIRHRLTKEQYQILKEKYPNSFYLHDDFYDEDGEALQPV